MQSFKDDKENDAGRLLRDTSPTSTQESDHLLTQTNDAAKSFKTRLEGFSYAKALKSNKNVKTTNSTAKRSEPLTSISKLNRPGEFEERTLRRSSRKRAITESQEDDPIVSVPKQKKRRTAKERAAADPYSPENNLVDSLRPGLKLVFIGLNPGLKTAATGHAYAHPSNMFWKLLHWSGITRMKHDPSETYALMDMYSIGNTNICKRPTRSGDGLSKDEMIEGASILEEKIGNMKPETVCIVGKGIWDTIYKAKTGKALHASKFQYGWQSEELWLGRTIQPDGAIGWQGSRTFVATSTSGLAAGLSPQQKLDIWKPLGQWMQMNSSTEAKAEESEVKQEGAG